MTTEKKEEPLQPIMVKTANRFRRYQYFQIVRLPAAPPARDGASVAPPARSATATLRATPAHRSGFPGSPSRLCLAAPPH